MLKSVSKIVDRCKITPKELEFFGLCFKYLDKSKAYVATHPNIDAENRKSVSAAASRLYSTVIDKFDGNLNDMMEVAGLGENRLVKEIKKGLKSNNTKVTKDGKKLKYPDNATRARTRELLAKVLIGDKKSVEVTTKQTSDIDLSKLSDDEIKSLKTLLDKAKPNQTQ